MSEVSYHRAHPAGSRSAQPPPSHSGSPAALQRPPPTAPEPRVGRDARPSRRAGKRRPAVGGGYARGCGIGAGRRRGAKGVAAPSGSVSGSAYQRPLGRFPTGTAHSYCCYSFLCPTRLLVFFDSSALLCVCLPLFFTLFL